MKVILDKFRYHLGRKKNLTGKCTFDQKYSCLKEGGENKSSFMLKEEMAHWFVSHAMVVIGRIYSKKSLSCLYRVRGRGIFEKSKNKQQ